MVSPLSVIVVWSVQFGVADVLPTGADFTVKNPSLSVRSSIVAFEERGSSVCVGSSIITELSSAWALWNLAVLAKVKIIAGRNTTKNTNIQICTLFAFIIVYFIILFVILKMNLRIFVYNFVGECILVDKDGKKNYNNHMDNMILEMETETLENQISFDFLEQDMKTKPLAKGQIVDWSAEDTLVLILKSKKTNADFSLCGKSMLDWVRLASSGCEQVILEEKTDVDVLDVARPYADRSSFVVVLYSDTPLLQKATFLEMMNYFTANGLNFMRLPRGVVFKSEYLKNAKMLMSTGEMSFGKDDFFVVDETAKISFSYKVLNERILSYHKENGVILFGENTIFIDADVEIEDGTIVYPNNILKGQTYIGKGVILESGNYIIDSIVCDGAFICQSYIESGKIENERTVGPFARIIKEKI